VRPSDLPTVKLGPELSARDELAKRRRNAFALVRSDDGRTAVFDEEPDYLPDVLLPQRFAPRDVVGEGEAVTVRLA
jgi:hypothetical protein